MADKNTGGRKWLRRITVPILLLLIVVATWFSLDFGADVISGRYSVDYVRCRMGLSESTECYRNNAEQVYEFSNRQITVVPYGISLVNGMSTYGAWAQTSNAGTAGNFAARGMTVTPPYPTHLPDGSTQAPVRMTQDTEGFLTYVNFGSGGKSNAAPGPTHVPEVQTALAGAAQTMTEAAQTDASLIDAAQKLTAAADDGNAALGGQQIPTFDAAQAPAMTTEAAGTRMSLYYGEQTLSAATP